jgi:hypothetical protein
VRGKGYLSILNWISIVTLVITALLAGITLVSYSRIRNAFPPGLEVAGVPVGGLDQQQAAERLMQAYGVPVELQYGDAIIHIKPSVVGFELDLESMLAVANLQRINQPFWPGYFDFLWNRLQEPDPVPLRAEMSEERLRSYLKTEIASRYDQSPEAAMPVPGTTDFSGGKTGTVLDIDRAVMLIDNALRSPSSRVVRLTYNSVTPSRPSMQNLKILLEQIIDVSRFDGITEIYLLDLETRQEINFAYQMGSELDPGIAFTAASTMKVPIMVSTFSRVNEPAPQSVVDLMELMIERSENDPSDRLMELVLDENLGPLIVTEDMNALGLENSFMAGYFYPGAPLLIRFQTPANQRDDVWTDPDIYNQTTAAEMGMMLDDIYLCANNGGGAFQVVFPNEITQGECRQMINYLSLNDIPVLIKAGLPEGTKLAHKHGWLNDYDGLMHTLGDVGIVYTPGGNYIMTIFMYHPVQLVFDPVNKLVADLSKAIYNYYNLSEVQ